MKQTVFIMVSFLACCSLVAAQEQQRVIVLTDIGGDPDDQQSMVRLMLYANEFDIEGLIATAKNSKDPSPEQIHERIDAYEKVLPNLKKHASGWPSATKLRSLVKSGAKRRWMTSVGKGKSTEASRHIIEVIDRPDPRPVWINVWGAPTDLAQALWDVRATRRAQEVADFVSKLRVYDIAGQDDTGGWISHHFPDIFWLRSVLQFQAVSVKINRPFPEEVTGTNIETFTAPWITEHVQSHGPLGRLYVDRKYKYEGDTPAFLYLVLNGLSDPAYQHYGGWGGRFNAFKTRNPGSFNSRYMEPEKQWRDFEMYTEAADTWQWKDDRYENNMHAALFRWREAWQNDFAARMDWSVTNSFEQANHNPVALLNGDTSKHVLYLEVKRGETVSLSATGSSDRDGNPISCTWTHYAEPGTYRGKLDLKGAENSQVNFVAPEVYGPETIHVLLTVKDSGSPALYAYRRVVITVNYN